MSASLAGKRVLLVSHVDVNLYLFRRALIAALNRAGVKVFAAVPPGDYNRELGKLDAVVLPLDLKRGSANPLGLKDSAASLRKAIARAEPDLIHSFTHQPNIISRLAAPKDLPVVNSITGLGSCFLGTGIKGAAMRLVFSQLYKRTASKCAALVFQNCDDLDYFTSRGMTGEAHVRLIRGSGVDPDRFDPGSFSPVLIKNAREQAGVGPKHVLVTLAARLIKDKGVYEFLQAAQTLAGTHPEARFMLVGRPDPGNPSSLTAPDLEKAGASENVIMAGWREDMPLVWAMSDVAVLPSYREGLPVSMQEALAAGLPVVVSDAPGCREIVDEGQNGYTVPVGQADPLARAITELVKDKSLRERMGRASRKKAVREFDASKLAGEHLKLYDGLLSP